MRTLRLAVISSLLSPLALLSAHVLGAQTPTFAADRLARVDSTFDLAVRDREIAGAVVLVLKDGQPAYERAFGWSDKESARKMRTDAIFRIASQSKAITSVAIMTLVEEGKVSLFDPVSKFIPGFAHTTVMTKTDAGWTQVPAKRQVVIRDLLTHSAGISYGTDSSVASLYEAKRLGPAAGWGWYTADKAEPVCTSMERLATLPFVAQPGEKFVYGYNTDILGCVVERASGMPLDQYIAARITGPLGMKDTHFFLPLADRQRLATVYMSTDSGIVRAPDGPKGQGDYVEGPRMNFAGGAGLLSSAHDYATFLEMLRRGGELNGKRILTARTVALMTSDQLGPLYGSQGEGFGLGFRLLLTPGAQGRMESVGTFGWGGAYGSNYEVDPKEHLVLVFMIQQLPNRSTLPMKWPLLVYEALVR